jgi:hypothetical protein
MSNMNTRTSARGGVHLVYQYFQLKVSEHFDLDTTKARQAEYDECLLRNLSHPQILQVHVLLENCSDKNSLDMVVSSSDASEKMRTVILGRQMKYSDAFEYCNNYLEGQIAVVLNADIFVGSDLDALLRHQKELFEVPTVLSLTRHESHICESLKDEASRSCQGQGAAQTGKHRHHWCGCPFFRGRPNYFGSHDSFWFVPPLKQGVLTSCQHLQNRWGAEHKVINELLRHGYGVQNPSISLRTFHNHISDIHPWRHEHGGRQMIADPRDHPPLAPTDVAQILENRKETRNCSSMFG